MEREEKNKPIHRNRNQQQKKHKQSWFMRTIAQFAFFLKTSEFAFLITLVGVMGQAFHIYHVVYMISDLTGWSRSVNAGTWATFFAFGVIFFTLKIGPIRKAANGNINPNYTDDKKQLQKYITTVNWFVAFEALINIYYWSQRLVFFPGLLNKKEYLDADGVLDWTKVDWTQFDWTRVEWPSLTITIPMAIAIPMILRAYAGEIRIKNPRYND